MAKLKFLLIKHCYLKYVSPFKQICVTYIYVYSPHTNEFLTRVLNILSNDLFSVLMLYYILSFCKVIYFIHNIFVYKENMCFS